MSESVATIACAVDIYPFEGGQYTFSGTQLQSCTTQVGLNGATPGTFSIGLPPGGPLGVDDPTPWSQVITPMSLVVIAMQRGSRAQVVLVGLVTTPAELIQWGSPVIRQQSIQGVDFTAFFTQFNWATFSTVGATTETAIGEALKLGTGGAIAQTLSPALFGFSQNSGTDGVSPVVIAQAWFNLMMGGSGSIMSQTRVPYQGIYYPVQEIFATRWENYLAEQALTVPMGDFLAAVDGTWMSKFQDLLPAPWYEFFIMTAPPGAYAFPGATVPSTGTPAVSGATGVTFGGALQFQSTSMPFATPAVPTIVARVKPIPSLTLNVTSAVDSGTFGDLDMSRWNALPLYRPDSGVLISQQSFDMSEIANTYFVSPKWIYANMMGTGTEIVPSTFLYIMGADAASIHRYGYKPAFVSTPWLYDAVYAGTNLSSDSIADLMATLLARLMSYYHPTALMAKAVVKLPLRPDIFPGCRFRYAPSKSLISWDFYVDSVSHNYNFGGDSISDTTLTLSRGLPTIIYESGGAVGSLLSDIHRGNAQRLDGQYYAGVPAGLGTPLQTVVPINQSALSAFLGSIASVYVTPQAQ